MKDFRILPEVADDVAAAADWYDRKGYDGLGERFITTFYSAVTYLRENGEIYRMVYSDFRRIWLRPFSYAVYYRYHGELLVVSLVIHAARKPARVRSILRARRQ